VKVYTSYKDVVVNQPEPPKFFDKPMELLAEATHRQGDFWEARRHDTPTVADQQAYSTINAVKSSPKVERFTTIIMLLGTGYKKLGTVALTYAYNNVEGHREFRFVLPDTISISFPCARICSSHLICVYQLCLLL